MMGNGTMNTTEANVHRISYTTPRDRMADAAALLIDNPSTFIPAMAAALRAAAKKRSRPHPEIIVEILAKEFAK